MFDCLKKHRESKYENIIDGLKQIYKSKLLPLEQKYKFHEFHSPALDDADFDAKPMILLVGQYSTGKTTFIRHLLESDFPGIRIGPEPTTDSFIAVMYNDIESIIPGNALVVDPKRNFKPLSCFGNAFLNRLQCSQMPNEVLRHMTFIDTPGILSGEKQRVDRGYDYPAVLEWFAERCDRILLLFDAHKVDISDEFKRSIEVLYSNRNQGKIRIVLNKADMINSQQLMKVYGALMWSLGKILKAPEVVRVYIGSFWDKPLHFDFFKELFELESNDLFKELYELPKNATTRKLNDFVKRVKLAKVHAYIIGELKDQMPSVFGKQSKKDELIKTLDKIYEKIQITHKIAASDFPNIEKMREVLKVIDFDHLKALDKKLIQKVDKNVNKFINMSPNVFQEIENKFHEIENELKKYTLNRASQDANNNPFGIGKTEGINAGIGETEWIVQRVRAAYDETFTKLQPVDGKISGAQVKPEMLKSKLPSSELGKVWKLADCDLDGFLDIDEFALAMYLIKIKTDGAVLPDKLPDHLIPPSKRTQSSELKNSNIIKTNKAIMSKDK